MCVVELEIDASKCGDHSDTTLIRVGRDFRNNASKLCGTARAKWLPCDWVVLLVLECRAEAHVDDVGTGTTLRDRRCRVNDAVQDPGERPAAAVQHLHPDDSGGWRDPYRAECVARRGDAASNVGRVPECVGAIARAGT